YGCTLGTLAGAMAVWLYRQPSKPEDSDNPLRFVCTGPVLPEFAEFEKRFQLQLTTGFGMTELSFPLAAWKIDDVASCGRVRDGYPGFEVRLVDTHDEEVPVGEVGEFVVRTSMPWALNAGYFGMPDKTADAWRNGWFHTGDALRRDAEGNFYFVDRLKDAIRRRAENISSFEVEAGVNEHP